MPVIPKEKWDTAEEYIEYLRHWAAYALLAEPLVSNKRVLEIGCGSGYGADYLSRSASSIIGVDISPGDISRCQAKYGKDKLTFLNADGLKLPFKSGSFDVVLSFQVIEHINPQNVLNYLSEIHRVLNREGTLLVTTPNSRMRLQPFEKPWNPEHEKEYKAEELKELLSQVFQEAKVYGLSDSDGIKATGYGRKKHSPLQAYLVLPVYRALGNLLPPPVLNRLKKLKRHFYRHPTNDQPLPQDTFIHSFSLNDFKLEPNCPEDCLDLYGICRKM
jgi:ubiquinone/menaquinone biosynthesis C-methylase UbiE